MITTPLLPPPASGGGVRKGMIIGQGGSDVQPPYSPLTKGDRGLYAFECDFVLGLRVGCIIDLHQIVKIGVCIFLSS